MLRFAWKCYIYEMNFCCYSASIAFIILYMFFFSYQAHNWNSVAKCLYVLINVSENTVRTYLCYNLLLFVWNKGVVTGLLIDEVFLAAANNLSLHLSPLEENRSYSARFICKKSSFELLLPCWSDFSDVGLS